MIRIPSIGLFVATVIVAIVAIAITLVSPTPYYLKITVLLVAGVILGWGIQQLEGRDKEGDDNMCESNSQRR